MSLGLSLCIVNKRQRKEGARGNETDSGGVYMDN